MVQASTELLGGAAVTVFLALLFFGVVVLWDVALALRSVGDKIDKLEDNIDDDLTDIAHSLDGMSNAPGGSGGTQLHLSGGTISSGPGAAGPQGSQQAQQTPTGQQAAAGAQGATAGEPNAAGEADPQPRQGPRQPEQRTEAARREPEGDAASVDDESATPPEPGEAAGADDTDTDTDDGEPESAESATPADGSDDAEDGSPEPDADESEPHPRAERNRGRFITSPDRTAWYATPLDREAIAAARPSIAGALPDGSEPDIDESEIIAAGPVDSVDAASDGGATAAESGTAPDADGEPAASIDDRANERTAESDGTDAERDVDTEAVAESDPDPEPSEPNAESPDADASAADPVPDSPEDIDVLSFEDGSESADGAAPDADAVTDLERPADDADRKPERADPDAADGLEPASEPSSPDSDAEPTDDGEPPGLAGFEFDAEEFEADDDVTVAEAVDTMNEDAPAPELSSHRFDVTAEETDGSAIVTLEFGADTVDITGSTKRLLQYQMRSFADRDSTPDGEVTIDRDRIVIEIPDSDGAAVKQWGEASVSIVDRTLYLSDNSS